MNDFDFDCLERKKLARQSRYRKNGSKSKKCNLPSDRLTHKQWKERCGPVMSYNFNSPMTWEDFKKLPGDVQEQYMNNLKEKYGATATDFARMFGVKALTVRRLVESNHLIVAFPRGHSMTQAQKIEWNKFLGAEQTVNEDIPESVEEAVESDVEIADPCVDEDQDDTMAMSMKKICLQFDGIIDIDMIANSLRMILGDNTVGEMEIVCNIR